MSTDLGGFAAGVIRRAVAHLDVELDEFEVEAAIALAISETWGARASEPVSADEIHRISAIVDDEFGEPGS